MNSAYIKFSTDKMITDWLLLYSEAEKVNYKNKIELRDVIVKI